MSLKYNPEYDFSNRGIDWQEYYRDIRLRTDAVWERQKLKDYFRLFYKIFYWHPVSKNYYITMPNHNNNNAPENWVLKRFNCYTPTGRSDSYERSFAYEYTVRSVSFNQADSIRDKNALCYYRFRSFKKCEGNSVLPLLTESTDEDGNLKPINMKCYQELGEMMQYCSPVQLNWMADLWHHMEMNQDPTNVELDQEMTMFIDDFDSRDSTSLTY